MQRTKESNIILILIKRNTQEGKHSKERSFQFDSASNGYSKETQDTDQVRPPSEHITKPKEKLHVEQNCTFMDIM